MEQSEPNQDYYGGCRTNKAFYDRNLKFKEAEKFRFGPSEEVNSVIVINCASIADEFIKIKSVNHWEKIWIIKIFPLKKIKP